MIYDRHISQHIYEVKTASCARIVFLTHRIRVSEILPMLSYPGGQVISSCEIAS